MATTEGNDAASGGLLVIAGILVAVLIGYFVLKGTGALDNDPSISINVPNGPSAKIEVPDGK